MSGEECMCGITMQLPLVFAEGIGQHPPKLDCTVPLQALVLVSAQLPNLANLDLLADPLHAVSGTS